LPFAGLQRALDIDLGALLQILLGHLAETFVEDHHAVPLGLFLALAAALVAPGLGGRDIQVGDRPAVLRAPDFRVGPEVPDQNHLVDTTRPLCFPILAPGLARPSEAPGHHSGWPPPARPSPRVIHNRFRKSFFLCSSKSLLSCQPTRQSSLFFT